MADCRNRYDLQGSADVDAMSVSVVVAAHNAADTIAETLMSALRQTHPTFEILVVDDASQDATAEVVQACAARDPRVRLIRLSQNRGVAGARNAGIREAKGDYVAPLDADDLWRPEKLSRQLQRFQTAPARTGVVYSWWHYVDVMGDLMPGRYGACTYEGDVYARLLMANFVGPSSVPLVRRELLHAAGLYDERLSTHEDKALHLALAEICDFAVVPECLVGYRSRPGSLSHKLGQLEACDSIVHAHARAGHSELPEWLFRRAVANFLWWVAFRHLHEGRKKEAMATAARVFLTDPGFALRPTALGAVAATGRAVLGRRKEKARRVTRPFLGGDAPVLQPSLPEGFYDRWRDRDLEGLRIQRPALDPNPRAPAEPGGGFTAAPA